MDSRIETFADRLPAIVLQLAQIVESLEEIGTKFPPSELADRQTDRPHIYTVPFEFQLTLIDGADT